MTGIKAPGVVVRIKDPIVRLPSRIVIPSADMDQIYWNRVAFIGFTFTFHTGQGCPRAKPVDAICALHGVLRFKGHPDGDQIFKVRDYDPCADMWEASWVD